jgi:hypothetical protein
MQRKQDSGQALNRSEGENGSQTYNGQLKRNVNTLSPVFTGCQHKSQPPRKGIRISSQLTPAEGWA